MHFLRKVTEMAKKRYYKSKKMGEGMFANMPQGSFMKAYPKNAYFEPGMYPDKLADIDRQINGDVMKAKRNKSNIKY